MIRDTETTFDVAIIGSGMSGAVLGMILARHGVRVLMIEGGVHPRFAVGESTIPHTSLLSCMLAERYDVPELETIAYPERIHREVASTSGIKRSFGFAYHRAGQIYDPRDSFAIGTSSKDENHLFRQDVDAWLSYQAVRYGAVLRQQTRVRDIEIDDSGVTLHTQHAGGETTVRARYLVDGSGFRSVVAEKYGLRENPPRFAHHSRSMFTHMVDVGVFDPDSPMSVPWNQSTLHHVFEGGWLWVIPFDNREGTTNPLVSIGLTIDPRVYPKPENVPAEVEFQQFLDRFPSVEPQFARAKTVRPWVNTGRLQYSSSRSVGHRWSMMSHASGALDPLFSRGLINTLEVTAALVDPLLEALREDDFADERFGHLEAMHRRVLGFNDRLVAGAFTATADFDLWNAWLRVWALATVPTEFRLMTALAAYTTTRDPRHLSGEVADPVFSDFEDPDYRAFFTRAGDLLDRFRAGETAAGETAHRILTVADEYKFPIRMTREGLERSGHHIQLELTEANLAVARSGFRWALTNPDCRDMFLNPKTFTRWHARRPDPHLA
ncbi:NAD(P)/FAD-dependent oxidoreductase [Nocardia terpenica]|uniref:FAD-dependent oxidoreductase n=1 Tax=Nocardia terpenica TaxID=455432 RepID=A0A291RGG9_9NOCA|nr:NAD(P)/FAD-dependent oxidoreductase [Nocardia terpenica]ATL66400.1 FAD-dependent oxidoreductase [Nocardia terpenica]